MPRASISLGVLPCAVGALAGIWMGAAAWAQGRQPETVTVGLGFLAERSASGKTKPAEDLSGLYCRPAGQDQFRCLVVNDEAVFVQWATYSAATHRLAPATDAEAIIPLIGATPPEREVAFDAPSSAGLCAGGPHEKFNEFDGEAVTWISGPEEGGTYFIVGSHSCSRGDSEDGVVARIQLMAPEAGPE